MENSIEEDKNNNFSLEAKFESMIEVAKKIINQNKNNIGDCSIETALAYDVANYLPKVLKENERYQKSDYETICLENNELREITDRIQSEYNDLLKDNFKLKDELETKRKKYQKTYQKTYKDVREELKELRKENEEFKKYKRYYDCTKLVVDNNYIHKQKIKDKIDKFDYEFKKAKRKNDNDRAEYYWNLIINFKKLLEMEE